jgi:hypothetical protein
MKTPKKIKIFYLLILAIFLWLQSRNWEIEVATQKSWENYVDLRKIK